MLVIIKISRFTIHTTLHQCWESSRNLKILSADHMWPAGL